MFYLAFGPIVHVMSTPWADSTVVLSAKVNCRPWVTVLFAQGTSVFRNRFSLGIHVHTCTPCTHSRSIYLNMYMRNQIWNKKQIRYSFLKQTSALFGSYNLANYHYGGIIKLIMTDQEGDW